jgi:hypothetical protein
VSIASLASDERAVHSHHRAVKALRLVRRGAPHCDHVGRRRALRAVAATAASPVPARSQAPDYARSREKPLVTGGRAGRLNLLRKGWMFGSMAEKLVHEGEGAISAVAWEGSLVAWANATGVKVIDIDRLEPVSFVAAPAGAPPADACPPRLLWESDTSLLVAWGADVRVITIRSEAAAAAGAGAAAAAAAADAPARRFGEVTAKFSVKDALVCGIAPFGSELALLW